MQRALLCLLCASCAVLNSHVAAFFVQKPSPASFLRRGSSSTTSQVVTMATKIDGIAVDGTLMPSQNNLLVKVRPPMQSTSGGVIIPDAVSGSWWWWRQTPRPPFPL